MAKRRKILAVDPLREIRLAMRRLRRAERWMAAELRREAKTARLAFERARSGKGR